MNRFDSLPEKVHGTRGRYTQGCRCDPCREASRLYYHTIKKRKTEATLAEGAPPVFEERMRWGKLRKVRVCPGINGKPCPHGLMLKKNSVGNICSECREKADWNGHVSAAPVLAHLRILRSCGVGVRTVAQKVGVDRKAIADILRGTTTKMRAKTAKKVLALKHTDVADGARVPAKETWRLINDLIKRGNMPRSQIAKRLGAYPQSFVRNREFILRRTASYVEQLHRKVFAELETSQGMRLVAAKGLVEKMVKEGITRKAIAEHVTGTRCITWKPYKGHVSQEMSQKLLDAYEYFCGGDGKTGQATFCTSCGLSHEMSARLERIRKMLPCRSSEIIEEFPCVYPLDKVKPGRGETQSRTLYRDLNRVGAVVVTGRKGHEGVVYGLPSGVARDLEADVERARDRESPLVGVQ